MEALSELRYALGLPADAIIDADGDLAATDERPIDAAAMVHAAETAHPSLAAARARANLAREEGALARATLAPPFAVGAPTCTRDRASRSSPASSAFRCHSRTPAPSRPLDSRRPRTAGWHTWTASPRRSPATCGWPSTIGSTGARCATRLSKEAVVPMREAVRLARVQYEAGTQDISSVLLARQRLLSAEEQLARAQAEVQHADLRVQLVSGTLLSSSPRGAR